MKKLICVQADTCLPDYWSGHHLPHIQIPVVKGMTLDEIKEALHDELRQGAIAQMYDDDPNIEQWLQYAHQSVDDIQPTNPEQKTFFNDLEDEDEDSDIHVYSFFVFIEDD